MILVLQARELLLLLYTQLLSQHTYIYISRAIATSSATRAVFHSACYIYLARNFVNLRSLDYINGVVCTVLVLRLLVVVAWRFSEFADGHGWALFIMTNEQRYYYHYFRYWLRKARLMLIKKQLGTILLSLSFSSGLFFCIHFIRNRANKTYTSLYMEREMKIARISIGVFIMKINLRLVCLCIIAGGWNCILLPTIWCWFGLIETNHSSSSSIIINEDVGELTKKGIVWGFLLYFGGKWILFSS